mgnify:CR=1 FL=1
MFRGQKKVLSVIIGKDRTLMWSCSIDADFGKGDFALVPDDGKPDFFCFYRGEAVLLDSARWGCAFEDGVPAVALPVFQAVGLDGAAFFLDDGDERDVSFPVETDFPPGLSDGGMRGPGGGEVVVAGEVAYAVVVAPRVFGGLVASDVAAGDGRVALGHRLRGPFMMPESAYLTERFDGVGIHLSVAVRGDVEDEVAVGVVVGTYVFLDEPADVAELVGRHGFLPEPCALERQAGEGRQPVLAGAYLLPCALLIRLDVGVEECLAGVFGGIEVHDEAVGLQALDVVVDVRERDVVVADARPGGVPAVDDEGRDVAVVREKFLELGLDELRVLGLDVSRTDAVVW